MTLLALKITLSRFIINVYSEGKGKYCPNVLTTGYIIVQYLKYVYPAAGATTLLQTLKRLYLCRGIRNLVKKGIWESGIQYQQSGTRSVQCRIRNPKHGTRIQALRD